MNILVWGGGGREHAMVKALKKSKSVKNLYAYPGSDGIFEEAQVFSSEKLEDKAVIIEKVKNLEIDLVAFGPEKPLVEGLSDAMREEGLTVFGPSQEGAKLEGDKLYSKIFMKDYGVPTGDFVEISNTESLKAALKEKKFQSPYVFKYKGLAGGKGVLVSESEEEVLNFAKDFGVTEDQKESLALLEEPLHGWELSCICLVNETGYEICPLLQDHKRLNNEDKGPNTGGMGVAGPLKIDDELLERIKKEVIEPSLEGLKKREIFYRGVLYVGLMITEKGPQVLEYNVRFGDPEAQLIFPMVQSDWAEVMKKVSLGESFHLEQEDTYGCAVVLASEGYPAAPRKGDKIEGLEKLNKDHFYHAGTVKKDDGFYYTSGGRVLNILGFGDSLKAAQTQAYKNAEKVEFFQKQMRTDIGNKIL